MVALRPAIVQGTVASPRALAITEAVAAIAAAILVVLVWYRPFASPVGAATQRSLG